MISDAENLQHVPVMYNLINCSILFQFVSGVRCKKKFKLSVAHKLYTESNMAEQLTEQDLSKPSNVLIFTAPIVCGDCVQKRTNVKNKGEPLVVSSMVLMSGK